MYELKLTDAKLGYVGTFRTKDYMEAKLLFKDFLAMKFSVELFDEHGKLLKHQTVFG